MSSEISTIKPHETTPDEISPIPETITSPEKLKKNIMELYRDGVERLSDTLEQNKVERENPRVLAIMSVWEAGNGTTQMMQRSLDSLVEQAKNAQIDLDILVVANNGGGIDKDNSQKLMEALTNKFADADFVETQKPTGPIQASTPWNVEVNFTKREEKGKNRVMIMKQPADMLNKGKIRALRDVSVGVAKAITQKGYAPDAIFQIDAETILSYENNLMNDTKETDTVSPLKALYNNLTRRNLVAVGTKDEFKIIDEESGEATEDPVGPAQLGYMLSNRKNSITLPGGALMSRPAEYLAAMHAIATVTPSQGVEDYMFTKILREEARTKNLPEESLFRSLGTIKHLNRTPKSWLNAVEQMSKWKSHASVADKIFPGDTYDMASLVQNAKEVIATRMRLSKENPKEMKQAFSDILQIPWVITEIYNGKEPNLDTVLRQEAGNWTAAR